MMSPSEKHRGASDSMTAAPPTIPPRTPLLHLSHPDHHIPGYEFPENASNPPSKKNCLIGFAIATLVAGLGAFLHIAGKSAPAPTVSLAWVAPFFALLGSIAIMPFAA